MKKETSIAIEFDNVLPEMLYDKSQKEIDKSA